MNAQIYAPTNTQIVRLEVTVDSANAERVVPLELLVRQLQYFLQIGHAYSKSSFMHLSTPA